jgi:hypothetical protein
MAKLVKVEGRTFSVPDDATPDEIDQISRASSPAPQIGTTPESMGIKNPIPTSQGVPPALRGPATMADKIKSGGASEMPGSFEGKPENTGQYIPNGPGAIARGGIDIARGNFAKGGHELISGVGTTTLPIAALTAPATAPAVLARGVAGGMVGSYAGGKLANLFGATPDQQDLVSDVGGIAGGYAGTDLLPKIGEAMQGTGAGIINRTVGLRTNDYARGANPGMAYLEGGNGPSLTMRSIAQKAEATNADSGAKLGNLYDSASTRGTKIPTQTVKSAIASPINDARGVALGPGGTGNAAHIDSYESTFQPALDKATAEGGFSPNDLFAVKRNIAKNTSFTTDPAQMNLKAVRQQNVGALGGVLSDAVPEAKPLNAIYQGSRILADRATERANTGSMPLTSLFKKAGEGIVGAALGSAHSPMAAAAAVPAAMAVDSVPVRTAVASGMFRGGKALSAGGGIRNLFGTTTEAAATPVTPQIRGLLKAPAIELPSSMEPIGATMPPPPVAATTGPIRKGYLLPPQGGTGISRPIRLGSAMEPIGQPTQLDAMGRLVQALQQARRKVNP